MPMTRPQKEEAVKKIQQLFEDSKGYFVADYQGLNVSDLTALRKNLRTNDGRFFVSKNSLFKLGAKQAGIDYLNEHFEGPTAVVFAAGDSAAAAKILHDSYKEKELPRIKAFVVEDQVFDAADIKRLADLPNRETLLSMVVAAVESPLTELVGTIDGFFRGVVGSIDALAEKRKSEA